MRIDALPAFPRVGRDDPSMHTKSYFSEGMKNSEGDEISTIEIKKILKEIVNEENKNKPLSDIELSDKLSKKGYKVARRTVSKYREQLDISVARLRKEL